MTARSRLQPGPAATAVLLALAVLGGCDRRHRHGPIEVSVIGPPLGTTRPTPDRTPLDAPAAALIEATGQGLVRFDASGQIVPGVAARWIVADNGRSLIFRLPDLPAPGTRPIDAADIARRIRAAISPGSRNPLKPLLGSIDEVNAVTPQVIDIELKAPRPNLLQLFAQPGLAMGGVHRGPFTITLVAGGVVALRPLADPASDPDDLSTPRPPIVHLRGERAATAVTRFVSGQSRLLIGGRFQDLPIARAASPPRNTLRFDPVHGLFGFAFSSSGTGLAATTDGRRALSMAIDRGRIQRLFDVPGWQPGVTLVAPGTPEVSQPASPSWASLSMADRTTQAGQIVARWRQSHGGASPPPLRVALPAGPGARILFASILSDWHAIGVDAMAVASDEPADMRLIDEVAPADIASFYLRAFVCERQVPCSDVSDRILSEVRDAPSLDERNVLLMQADALIADTVPFIPLGMPIRWSLVSPDLNLYRDSPRGMHPLNELRTPPKR